MKHWLCLTALICFGSIAKGQELTYQTISTSVVSGVFASSQTPTEVDNLNLGSAYVLPNRNQIILSVPASGKVNCAFDVSVSSVIPTLLVASPHYGTEYTAGVYTILCPTNMKFYCLSVSISAGQALSVRQESPWKPGSRTIPGT